MTYGVSGGAQPSKNEKRVAARDKAKLRRLEQKKKEKRNRALIQGGVIVGVLAVIVVVVLVIVSNIPKPNPGPLNMLSDGIRIGADFTADRTAALQPEQEPVPSVPSDDPEVVDIRIYLDYFCPACGAFEKANNEQIATWVQSGAATVEIHPVSFLDRSSLGTKYSSRAANAAACVANYAPDQYFDFSSLLFAEQPAEGTEGLNDEQLIGIVGDAGVKSSSAIESCIKDNRFKKWVNAATARAFEGPLPGVDVEKIERTPTVFVNGVQFTGDITDATVFAKFVSTASGNAFSDELKATMEPSTSPSPSAEAPAE
ncbi:protein-disulfide isomerase [Homoserinimonas aerilata]|uniref:Protein-disulfide isomerase n=1 Tax=Homoserinimonas aerilata TaxID=1162970 RepID=A0A542YGE2_9MICO|nr:thioredoxin domain-containing protein [Homoserinimonas aerilata]TQL47044.1 protein-disulfide isomerase [Homoserinimonas aerilata]